MRRALAAAVLAAGLPGCAEPVPVAQGPAEVRVAWDGGEGMAGCRAEVGGRATSHEALFAAARGWRARGAKVVGGPDIPYKCLGWVIFTLQRAGIKRVGFVAEPPPGMPER